MFGLVARLRNMRQTIAGAAGTGPEGSHEAFAESDIELVMDEKPSALLQRAGYLIAVFMLALLVIATLVKIDVVIEATGELVSEVPPIVLQPMERSIIRSINVKPGDVVSANALLASLDATFIQADIQYLRAQHKTTAAQVARLQAEAKGVPLPPPDNGDASGLLQYDIYRQRQDQYASRMRAFDEDIQRIEATIRAVDGTQGMIDEQLDIAQQVEGMRMRLLESQVGSKLQFLESRNSRLHAEREQQLALSRKKEFDHTLATRRAERQSFIDEWRRQTLEELERQQTALTKIDEVISKADRMQQLIEIRAPEDGVVLETAVRSAGSVVREAEPLIVISPASATLIAEVFVKSSDVGYAQPGDAVELKVDAFPYQRHGKLEGRLLSVSERSYETQIAAAGIMEGGRAKSANSGWAKHRARIELTRPALEKMAPGARVFAGMTVTAEIKVGTRSVISYFIEPIRRGFDEAMREP